MDGVLGHQVSRSVSRSRTPQIGLLCMKVGYMESMNSWKYVYGNVSMLLHPK